jgi:hypothetical protein
MRKIRKTYWLIGFSASQLIGGTAAAQSWNESAACHINARTSDTRFADRSESVDATFRWRVFFLDGTATECTAVLMNREVSQDELGYYFSTARHCIHYNNVDLGGPDINFNELHQFTFHYQSPNGDNAATKSSNRGEDEGQSIALNDNRFEYFHLSKVELVEESIMADYALFRMVTPPPPHFNLYHAGWHPSSSGIPPNLTLINPCGQWHGYVLPNHPRGDVKKINGAAALQNPTALTYVVCNVVTTVIDVLFGWLWGNSSSTQSICSYTDFPWYTVEWCDHGIEGGSSGSPLFNSNNRYIGPLSGIGSPCAGWVPTTIGKFKNVYPFASIKNTLNPSHNLGVDLWGINGRRISCYTNLELPGSQQQTTYYFPANHYQSENRIQLRAQEQITVVAPIKILNGAHYEFLAGNSIDINGIDTYVDVHPGATFVAAIEGCTKSAPSALSVAPQFAFQRLPERLEWKPGAAQAQADEIKGFLLLQPNPATGTTRLLTDMQGPLRITVINATGQAAMQATVHDVEFNVSTLPAGMYLIRAQDANGEHRTARLVKE